jgi:hypothetical protein
MSLSNRPQLLEGITRSPKGKLYRVTDTTKVYYTPRICLECRHLFLAPSGDVKRGKGRYCSRTCADLSRTIDNPTYHGAHERVRRSRGLASEWFCTDCPTPTSAAEWSYDGLDPDDLTEPANGRKYSANPDHYQPRCVPCHRQHDGNPVVHQSGERNPNAKLTDAQVRGIKASVGVSDQELAEHFGVNRRRISALRKTPHIGRRKAFGTSSRFYGVSWDKRQSKWYAFLKLDGKRIFTQYHGTEEAAARAWDAAVISHGLNRTLNFALQEKNVGEAVVKRAEPKSGARKTPRKPPRARQNQRSRPGNAV